MSSVGWSLVFTTASNEREAERIARHLLKQKWVACVNMLPRVHSLYWWKGKIEKSREWVLLIKTRARNFNRVSSEIQKISSYECPEVISVPIQKGSRDYLAWLSEVTKK
jgi:periplasmic divalent cation tolerance protein